MYAIHQCIVVYLQFGWEVRNVSIRVADGDSPYARSPTFKVGVS